MENHQHFSLPNMAVLMEDGARAHTARASMEQVKAEVIDVWQDWPGNSPT